ncbi:plasmalemma vesicle associated protein [Willisornis vidua]|uniref:Plasmalemma vesicle associated protein n=1 Tax=Willisornis vidua TaxID=1566151 RepID=A0ABQ9DBG1_9PASS|nr:plasmalemma vesicle associated protein [Willisornis vidua]
MEKSSFGVAKFGLEAKEAMPKRDCGFYVKYIFLFTSLIQFLIILGLVLFMVYGNAQAGTDTHLRLLEEQLQDRYNKIITLGTRNLNLTRALNATLKDKDKLQGAVQKLQRDLDKCNSTQTPNNLPQMHPFFDMQGSRVPGSAGRSGSFPSTGYYADYLKNQGVFGNMGKANTEEMQRLLKMVEQYTAALKNNG